MSYTGRVRTVEETMSWKRPKGVALREIHAYHLGMEWSPGSGCFFVDDGKGRVDYEVLIYRDTDYEGQWVLEALNYFEGTSYKALFSDVLVAAETAHDYMSEHCV